MLVQRDASGAQPVRVSWTHLLGISGHHPTNTPSYRLQYAASFELQKTAAFVPPLARFEMKLTGPNPQKSVT
jgi:hypothetical protein